ncbi:MAG: hypothetical protein JRD68_05185 [Deltaproteobacteria bacterium]|nr:hypothetical protein [Deltaproteobacteria bacterium]
MIDNGIDLFSKNSAAGRHPARERIVPLFLGFYKMRGRYIGISAVCLLLFLALGCNPVRYAAVDSIYMDTIYEDEPARAACGAIDLKRIPENPALYTRCVLIQMTAGPDETVRALGEALSRLPDVHHRSGPLAALGIKNLYEMAVSATVDEKTLLHSLALENVGEYQYSGSLQGLLWMAGQEGFSRTRLRDETPETLLAYAWEELGRRLSRPEEILKYLSEHYSYIMNAGPVQPLLTFFKSKYGDCSEFSLLAGYFLHELGFEVSILLTRPTSLGGHISVVFRDDRGYWLLDGSRAAITRILEQRKAREPLNFFDQAVWRKIQNFNRLYGPFSTREAAVSRYEQGKRGKVPFTFITYETYSTYIEAYGAEAGGWWRF